MKTSKITLSAFAILFAMAVAVVSCKKKDNTTANDTDASTVSDNSLAEKTADDVTTMGAQSSETGSMSSYREGEENLLTACATVTRDTVLKKITVSFNGSACLDGHVRTGTLVYDYSGSTNGAKFYRNPGYQMVVSSNGYTVDGNAVSISKTVKNITALGFNPTTTNETWSDNTSVSVAKSNGTLSWSANKTKTLLNTSDTSVYHGQAVHITWSKAIIGISGNASGTTATGETFTANSTSQLVRDFGCSPNLAHQGHHPLINGALDFTPGTKATRHIDYGYPNNGACDDQALVTIGTYTVAITLP